MDTIFSPRLSRAPYPIPVYLGDQYPLPDYPGAQNPLPDYSMALTLQRQNTEILKQIFPEKKYWGLSPNFHIQSSVSDLCISMIGLPILLEEICIHISSSRIGRSWDYINRSQTHEY
jgi:hypothetical protein